MDMNKKIFIDASLFLGMHKKDEAIRIACKNFFVGYFTKKLNMSLEHVGKCDDVIWKEYSPDLQDAYYPFMDRLHQNMQIKRIQYQKYDLELALKEPLIKEFNPFHSLLLAQVINHNGVLYTLEPHLLERKDLPIKKIITSMEAKSLRETKFPKKLEARYQTSLVLKT